jgi:DNA-binding transcriptional regulator LsrR (DeoR family)
MVAGFNVTDPSTDPNTFFTYFTGEPALQVQTGLMGLPAPGIVKSADFEAMRAHSYMREAFKSIRDIDIVVTSAGSHWQEGHSSFYSMLRKASPRTVEQLTDAGCIGDMMWRPLSRDGPLRVETEMRTVTLMELCDLTDFIKKGNAVLLLLGPCGTCTGPKVDVLRAILGKQRLITHLVVDSRSARGFLS